MPVATYEFRIDWDRNGTFGTGSEEVSTVVLGDGCFIDRGMDTAQAIPVPMVGGASLSLKNDDYEYHPENSSSAVYAQLIPGREVRIRATHNAVTYTLFRGPVADFHVDPNPGRRRVGIECYGAAQRLAATTISTEVFEYQPTGTLVGEVLDAAGWSASRRDLDTGSTMVPYFWAHNKTAWAALQELLLAEGPGSMLFESGAGDIVFHDRNHRMNHSASTTSQATFRDTGSEPTYQIPQVYTKPWAAVINDITIPVTVRDKDAVQVVWDSGTDLVCDIGDAETFVVNVELDDAVTEAVAPVFAGFVDVGYLPGTLDPTYGAPASITLNRTSGQSFVITLTAGATDKLKVTYLQLRARPFLTSERQVTDEDTTSQTAYEVATPQTVPQWQGLTDADAVAASIIHHYKDAHARVTIRVSNGDTTRFTAGLARELNDRVTIIDASAGMSKDFFVERISHEITQAGRVHHVVLECAEAVTPVVSASEVFLFNHATQGKFNTGKFGV